MLTYFIYTLPAVALSFGVLFSLKCFGLIEKEGQAASAEKEESCAAAVEPCRDATLDDNREELQICEENNETDVVDTAEIAAQEESPAEKISERDESVTVSAEEILAGEEEKKANPLAFLREGLPYRKRTVLILAIASTAFFIIINCIVGKFVHPTADNARLILSFVKLMFTLGVITSAALVDLKKRIIPNKLVLIGLGVRLLIYVLEFLLCRSDFTSILFSDLVGFGIGFGILGIAAFITKGAVGFGDAKLFAFIGLTVSGIATFGTLLFSLFASAVAGVILMIKFKDKKMGFPFAPFILIGYVAVLLSGNF